MLKKFLPVFCLVISLQIFAQSPKTVLIEHFTNTKCSICASRNPGFYSTLSAYPQVIHIAFHPSAPYATCYFNLQNVAENDDRTMFYGVYGSTPRVVLNGNPLPAANPVITTAAIDAELNQTSPVEVAATEELTGIDSVKVRVVVRTTGTIAAGQLLLFAGVAQDTIQYSAGNGEQLHHDVFRKALTRVKGDTIQVPALNDSLVLVFKYKIQSNWRGPNLSTITWLQLTDTKEVLNAGRSHRVVSIPSGINNLSAAGISVYPNPATDKLIITGYTPTSSLSYAIFDLTGRKMIEQIFSNPEVDISDLTKGIYFLKINNAVVKFVKE